MIFYLSFFPQLSSLLSQGQRSPYIIEGLQKCHNNQDIWDNIFNNTSVMKTRLWLKVIHADSPRFEYFLKYFPSDYLFGKTFGLKVIKIHKSLGTNVDFKKIIAYLKREPFRKFVVEDGLTGGCKPILF